MSTPSSETPATTTDTAVESSSWRHELPYRQRMRPRSYGTGHYGVDRYDSRDNTRYAWERVIPTIGAGFAAIMLFASPARATNAYCESADATTSVYGLCKPAVDVEGANTWGDKMNTNMDMLESAIQVVSSSVTDITSKVSKAGDTMTGPLVINSSLTVQTSTFVVSGGRVGIGTASPQYPLDVVGTVNSSTFSVSGGTQPSLSIFSQGSTGPNVISSTGSLRVFSTGSGGVLARFISNDTDNTPSTLLMNINPNSTGISGVVMATSPYSTVSTGKNAGMFWTGSSGDFTVGKPNAGALIVSPNGALTLSAFGNGDIKLVPTLGGISLSKATTALSSFTVSNTDGILVVGGSVTASGLFANSAAATTAFFGTSGATVSTFTSTGRLQMAAAGILWPDGTTSTTAVTVGGAAVLIATQTFSGANTFTAATTFSGPVSGIYNIARSSGFVDPNTASTSYVGVSGSSVTINNTVAGNRLCVSGSLSWFNDTTAAHNFAQLILDGAVVQVVCYTRNTATGYQQMCPISAWTAALGSGGTHTLSLMVKVDGGTLNLDSSAKSTLMVQECGL